VRQNSSGKETLIFAFAELIFENNLINIGLVFGVYICVVTSVMGLSTEC
jgi:hypothetical protein